MPIHDELASTVSLARVMLSDLDSARVKTEVDTAQLRLILMTLIENSQPIGHDKMAETAGRTVMGMMAQFATIGGPDGASR